MSANEKKYDEYKYAFIGSETEDIRFLYADFNIGENRIAIFPPKRYRSICKFASVKKLSKLQPFRGIEYKGFEKYIAEKIKKKGWDEEDKIVFILYGRSVEAYGSEILYFLRNRYINCIVVAYFGDILARHQILSIEKVKDQYDAVFTCDTTEAEKYGMHWCMEPFSRTKLKKVNHKELPFRWDVTFVGHAKDRYGQIIELYEALKKENLKCDFHITGVAKEDRKYVNEIAYTSLSFMQILEHVSQSRCIAEIVQGGASFPTTRYSEALFFRRNLLTNAEYFKTTADEIPENVIFFNKIGDIGKKEIAHILSETNEIDKKYKNLLSIESMIKTINKVLEENDD